MLEGESWACCTEAAGLGFQARGSLGYLFQCILESVGEGFEGVGVHGDNCLSSTVVSFSTEGPSSLFSLPLVVSELHPDTKITSTAVLPPLFCREPGTVLGACLLSPPRASSRGPVSSTPSVCSPAVAEHCSRLAHGLGEKVDSCVSQGGNDIIKRQVPHREVQQDVDLGVPGRTGLSPGRCVNAGSRG